MSILEIAWTQMYFKSPVILQDLWEKRAQIHTEKLYKIIAKHLKIILEALCMSVCHFVWDNLCFML